MLDLILKNGKIVDGTGNPWFNGDIGIKDGFIVEIGNIKTQAKDVIDVKRHVISPGFIDMHTHSDLMRFNDPLDQIKLQQGVTTEVVGNCGLSVAPVTKENEELLKNYTEPVIGKTEKKWNWNSFGEYLDELSKHKFSCNIASCVGNGAIRIATKGFDPSPLTKSEMENIKKLIEESMESGAVALSFGIMYAPEFYYRKEELIEIGQVLSKYNGVLTTHIRGEGNSLVSSVKEVIEVAEISGISLNISHFKAVGKKNWGTILEKAMKEVEDARKRGVDVTCDVYPYNAGSTTLLAHFPTWSLEGGVSETLKRIKNKESRERIYKDLNEEQTEWDNVIYAIGWEKIFITSLNSEENKKFIGMNMKEISELRKQDTTECAMDMVVEENGRIGIVLFHMSEEDVEKVIKWDKSLVISDSLCSADGNPHPRLYGTFPRLFAKYVREKKTISLEEAVRKVTSFPVQRLNLGRRGLLAPNYIADIVVFDPDAIQDMATYENPTQYPKGIDMVIVGGKITIRDGKHLGAKNGKVIRKEYL